MAADIGQNIINLFGRKEIELAEFFVGGRIEVDGYIVQGVEVCLQLLVIGFAQFGSCVVDVEDDFVEIWQPNPSPSLKGREKHYN